MGWCVMGNVFPKDQNTLSSIYMYHTHYQQNVLASPSYDTLYVNIKWALKLVISNFKHSKKYQQKYQLNVINYLKEENNHEHITKS